MSTMDLVQQRIEAGAAYLDEVAPGWHNTINLNAFDIASPVHCVCAQTFGGWRNTPKVKEHHAVQQALEFQRLDYGIKWTRNLREHLDWTRDHGFELSSLDTSVTFSDLNKAWKAEILRRRDAECGALATILRMRAPLNPAGAYSLLAA